jgi:hypothetical protein
MLISVFTGEGFLKILTYLMPKKNAILASSSKKYNVSLLLNEDRKFLQN